MNPKGLALLVGSTLLLFTPPPTFGIPLPGGKAPGEAKKVDKASDCWVGLEVDDSGVFKSNKKNKVIQRACNGGCVFNAQICVNEVTAKCTTVPALTSITSDAPALTPPTTLDGTHQCGATGSITATEGTKTLVNLTANAASGGPDTDLFKLVCKKNKKNKGCTGTTTTTMVRCPANSAGGPDKLLTTVLGNGTDLDNGWTGTSHNFPVIKDAQVVFCLSGCDASTNPACTSGGPTGAGTDNGVTFGPPLPLIAGGVAVCVVNRYQTQGANGVSGTINVQTGEGLANVDLFSDVYVTDSTKVCPKCEGTCDSGANRGKSCSVDGEVTVVNSLAQDKTFKLSKGCPPLGTAIATLNIPLRLTTGSVSTPGTGGSKPCRENEAHGVTVQDDNCGAAGCGAPCQPGSDSCKTMAPDPSNPSSMVCVDAKGGISQVCCNSNPAVPCFATRPPGPGIVRTGHAVVALPAWPDPTYPKTVDGEVQVSTFCEAATGSFNVDSVAGLPGPGAVVFNLRMEFSKQP